MAEKPRMYILTGISFAGKTTLGKAIARATGSHIVELNQLLQERSLEGQNISGSQFARIHKEVEGKAKELLQAGKDVVYDTTPFAQSRRDHLRELATDHGAEPIIIFVHTPRAIALQRWERNNFTHERLIIHRENFNYVADHFEPPREEEHIVFQVGDTITEWVQNNILRLDPVADPPHSSQISTFYRLKSSKAESLASRVALSLALLRAHLSDKQVIIHAIDPPVIIGNIRSRAQ